MDLPSKLDTLELERQGPWLSVWLNRPRVRNALSAEMVEELLAVLEAAASDRSLRGLTLRGRGGVFCAGGDIKGFQSIFQGTATLAEVADASRQAGRLYHRLRELPQVSVVLVEGAAMAGGLGMACAADVVIVARDAKFGLTETTLGIPPAQIAPLVVGRIGAVRARRLMLTAARFDGAQAGALGIADFVEDDSVGMESREATVRSEVLRCAPRANAVTAEIVSAASRLERDAMIEFAANAFAECLLGEEAREGVAAFMEKRRPSWGAKP